MQYSTHTTKTTCQQTGPDTSNVATDDGSYAQIATDPLSKRIMTQSREPSLKDRATLDPSRAVSVLFRFSTILDEQGRLEQALEAGGYRAHSRVQLFSIYDLVDEAIVSDLHEIAMELNISDYELEHKSDFDATLNEPVIIATCIFEDRKDAKCFRSALKRVGCTVMIVDKSRFS